MKLTRILTRISYWDTVTSRSIRVTTTISRSTGARVTIRAAISIIRLRLSSLDVTFATSDNLFRFTTGSVSGFLGIKDDEAEFTSTVSNLVEGQFNAINAAISREVLFNLFFSQVGVNTTNEDLFHICVDFGFSLPRVDDFVPDRVGP